MNNFKESSNKKNLMYNYYNLLKYNKWLKEEYHNYSNQILIILYSLFITYILLTSGKEKLILTDEKKQFNLNELQDLH